LTCPSDRIKEKGLGEAAVEKLIEIPSTIEKMPAFAQRLRVAAYCRVSTEQEEQRGSLESQEQYYSQIISSNPLWTNAGIFSEMATGLNLKERSEFHAMMQKCRKGKIDLILTKSISRFGRNTLDMLKALRELDALGIEVYFEKENLCLSERELSTLLSVYCAFAQSESESMSRSIRWGVRQGFQSGTSGYAEFVCFGYKQGDDGKLAIDEPDAEIVRNMFKMRAEGRSLSSISAWLYENRIPSPAGKEHWSRETINKLLHNEKYVGDVLLQKTFVEDMFSGKQVKNNNKLQKVLIQNHHPAIVSRELFQMVLSITREGLECSAQ